MHLEGESRKNGVDWRAVAWIASTVIGVLLIIIGYLIQLGLSNNATTLRDLTHKLDEVKTCMSRLDQQVKDHLKEQDKSH